MKFLAVILVAGAALLAWGAHGSSLSSGAVSNSGIAAASADRQRRDQ